MSGASNNDRTRAAGGTGPWSIRRGARRMAGVLLQPWLVTFIVLQGAGWWIYHQQAPIDGLDLPVYLLSAACSASFWLALNLGRDALGTVGRFVAAAVVGTCAVFVIAANYQSYIEFGEFVSASMVSYAGKGGVSTFQHYVETYLEYPLDLLFIVGTPVLTAVWIFGAEVDFFESERRERWAAGVFALFALTLVATSLLAHRRHLAPDTALGAAALRSSFMPVDNRLHSADRKQIPEPPPEEASPPNVVLIVNESLGTHEVDFTDDTTDALPYVESWLETERERVFAFERAYANSTSTDVSVPTMLTGIGPQRPPETLHSAPLAWDWARRAGLEPFYVSAQNYSATNFPEFFFAGDPMPVLRPNTIPEIDKSGDFAVDELRVANEFADQLDRMPDDSPVFAVYNSNAVHKPFQANSPRLDEPPQRGSRYRNALSVLDRALERIIEALERQGRLDNTLLILTADHGEYPERDHRVPRILSAYEEFVRVPLVVRVPERWADRHPDAVRGLAENVRRNVQNIDLVPTIVDVLEYDQVSATGELREGFDGASLLRPVPSDRMIYVLNNNAVRHWEHQSFGIYWSDWRFVFSDIQGPRLFDIADDPEQRDDRWNRAPAAVRTNVMESIRANQYLSEIWETSRPHGTTGLRPIFR